MPAPAHLDRFDVQLLDALQHDCRTAAETLGARIGLSATAVQRRIRRLKEVGLVIGEAALLSPAVIPGLLIVIVQVALKQGLAAATEAFKDAAAARPEVQQCYYVAGEYDFVLIVAVDGMQAYERFTRDFFFPDENIARFTSTMVMEPVKRNLRLPLREG